MTGPWPAHNDVFVCSTWQVLFCIQNKSDTSTNRSASAFNLILVIRPSSLVWSSNQVGTSTNKSVLAFKFMLSVPRYFVSQAQVGLEQLWKWSADGLPSISVRKISLTCGSGAEPNTLVSNVSCRPCKHGYRFSHLSHHCPLWVLLLIWIRYLGDLYTFSSFLRCVCPRHRFL